MEPDTLLDTFSAHYQSNNPRAFWDRFLLKLNKSMTGLEWGTPPGPKVIAISDTTWQGKIWQWYGGVGQLSCINVLLVEMGERLQANFSHPNRTISRKAAYQISPFSSFLSSFRDNILNIYLAKPWKTIDDLTKKDSFKRNFTSYIPLEISRLIFGLLPASSLSNAQRVCREWKCIIRKEIWIHNFNTIHRLERPVPKNFGGVSNPGDNLTPVGKGMVFGTTATVLNRRETANLWKNGILNTLVKIRYMPSLFHRYVSTLFISENRIVVFKNLGIRFHVELWENYLSNTPQCLWFSALDTLTDIPMIKLHNAHVLNEGVVICEAWEFMHINDGKCLCKIDLEKRRVFPIDTVRYSQFTFINSRNILCYKNPANPLFYKRLNENGIISDSFDLGLLDPSNLYYWCEDYISFWTDNTKKALIVFLSPPQGCPMLEKPITIPLGEPISHPTECSGVRPYMPLFVWSSRNRGDSYLYVQNFITKQLSQDKVKFPDPIAYFHFISPYLLLTCTHPTSVKRFDIALWDLRTMICKTQHSYQQVNNSGKMQFLTIRNGFSAVNLSGKLLTIKHDNETQKIDIKEYPSEVIQITTQFETLIILPKGSEPIIATL